MRQKVELVAADVERLREEKVSGEFVLGMYRLLHRIDADPELSEAIGRENEATLERRAAFQFYDNAAVGQLVALRRDLAEAMGGVPGAADLDDSAMTKPDFASPARLEYDFSLANFDAIAEQSRELRFPASQRDTSDPSRTTTLINILSGKSRQLREAADAAGDDEARDAVLKELSRRLENIIRLHEHSYHRYILDSRTLAALAYGRLALVVNALNPEPIIVESDEDEERFANAAFEMVLSPGWAAQKAVFGGRVGDVSDYAREQMLEEARENLDLLVEALHWTAAETPEAKPAPTVQIAGSVVGAIAVASGPVTQGVSQEGVKVENYWEPLQGELAEAGLPDDEIQALKTALEEDAAAVDEEGPGGATRRWLASVGRKVADGALAVSVELVAALIKKHAGLGL